MIELSDTNGRKVFLATAAIAEVREAEASSQWHGIRAYVKTFDGRTFEARETAEAIAKQVAADERPNHG